jgi:hypothetical protein
MYFQLLKLIVWPKSDKFPPRVVPFKPGIVNVITGKSRTGKSAIIPIIDYCLASSDCFIPIDTIRDHASWYGIVCQLKSEQLLLCRKTPTGTKCSDEFFLARGDLVSVPPIIGKANETSEGVKHLLNALSAVPYFSLDGGEKRKGSERLSFRDLMALVFQNQDLVANQNIFFYKTHEHIHREKLRNWFPFILGAEMLDSLQARYRLQDVVKRLNQHRRDYDKAKSVSAAWLGNMLGHLKLAKEYGLLDQDIFETTSPEELVAAAREIINNIPDHPQTDINHILYANTELAQLETLHKNLSDSIGIASKRLEDIKNLRSSLVNYGDHVKKRVERMHISQWLEDIAMESAGCPACGSHEHPKSKEELSKVAAAFRKYEEESRRVAEVPTSFAREEDRITSELKTLLEQRRGIQKQIDVLKPKDKKAQEEFQQRKNMFLFLGHLKASMENFEKLADGGEFQKEIALLEDEQNRLIALIDNEGLKRRISIATAKISEGMPAHLKTLDVEEKYRQVAPRFSIKDLNISVLSNDEHWHVLAEVGSASNWLSFHIALMCSLQEYFFKRPHSCVPSFVVFDQPSQVYFPKLKRNQKEVDDQMPENEDIDAVRSIFQTIATSIKKTDGAWQAIVLDHADSGVYGGIEGVYEVDEWRGPKKLIPEEWYLAG